MVPRPSYVREIQGKGSRLNKTKLKNSCAVCVVITCSGEIPLESWNSYGLPTTLTENVHFVSQDPHTTAHFK
jgi:hypothetical protein